MSLSARSVLDNAGLRPKKSFGQNFLQDQVLLKRIAEEICALRETSNSPVYELGAGLGALTRTLLDSGALVHAIERDRDLIPILNQSFETEINSGQLIIHEENATTFFHTHKPERKFVLCGNLPYHLSSSIFFETAFLASQLSGAVYLIQKEVAERIVAKPHSKTYGLLSVIIQSRFEAALLESVSAESFWPIPRVDSSVIKLHSKAILNQVDFELFIKLVKKAFNQRRKTLRNSLSGIDLERAGISPNARAENLSFEDYERLAQSTSTQH